MTTIRSVFHTFIDPLRDRWAPANHNSNFRETGEISPEEFEAAGDFLVHKFPSWSWSATTPPGKTPAKDLPPEKQYLVTRGVPCRKRIKADDFAGSANGEDQLVRDMLKETGAELGGEDDGWLKAGGDSKPEDSKLLKDVRTVDEDGKVSDEDIPDMDDEIVEEDDEEAIIRDGSNGLRYYTLYITYSGFYRTPRLYMMGYDASNHPLPSMSMMDDIVSDYDGKTVTLENFPYISPPMTTASVHPCKHASVMKVLLDRADAALKLRTEKLKHGEKPSSAGMEGLVEQTSAMDINKAKSKDKDNEADWEVLSSEGAQEADVPAIRVDQYLIVFLKFMASVTPGISHDFTMSV